MGELNKNPIHNVFKKYRKMNLVNPYRFGVPAFVSSWNTANTSTGSSTSTQVKLPLIATGTYNFTVNWGDGNSETITAWDAAAVTHTYLSSGTYTITISGTCTGWQFNNTGDRNKILTISSWGSLRLGTTQGNYFYGCSNLNISGATDVLNLTGTTSLLGCFRSCTALTTVGQMNNWDVSAVTIFVNMFQNATNFNQNISSWNTAAVTNMFSMFQNATNFNQNISSWNTAAVTRMNSMFSAATSFNQNIGSWNVSNVTSMDNMFSDATSFNQNIGSWNVSNVTSFSIFMAGKTAANFSTTNLDAIYNGWTNRLITAALTITFNTVKYTAAATEGRALLTRTNSTKSITNVVNNGSGLIRISATAHGLSTGNKCFISGVLGTTEANGAWIVTVIDSDTIDLQASTFTNTYTSAGTLRTGYGWTITDGGI